MEMKIWRMLHEIIAIKIQVKYHKDTCSEGTQGATIQT
jgi:hypothetical protein